MKGWLLHAYPSLAILAALALLLTFSMELRLGGQHPAGDLPEIIELLEALEHTDEVARTRTIVEANVFRIERGPAAIRFAAEQDPQPQQRPTPPVPAQPHPNLLVTGILGGPPWEAVVEGLPGRSMGIVVRAGESYEGARVLRVTRDSVLVRISDSTYRLAVRSAW